MLEGWNNRGMRSLLVFGAIAFSVVAACGGASTSTIPASDAGSSGSSGASGSSGSSGSSGTSGTSGTTPGDGGGSGSVCDLPKQDGNCDGAIPRYWFNKATGECEFWSYGGCGGNANNFETVAACADACLKGTDNPCSKVECRDGQKCVFISGKPTCASDCDNGKCPVTNQACTCGSSCPNCKDCRQVCN